MKKKKIENWFSFLHAPPPPHMMNKYLYTNEDNKIKARFVLFFVFSFGFVSIFYWNFFYNYIYSFFVCFKFSSSLSTATQSSRSSSLHDNVTLGFLFSIVLVVLGFYDDKLLIPQNVSSWMISPKSRGRFA